jgi:hypothetical protein
MVAPKRGAYVCCVADWRAVSLMWSRSCGSPRMITALELEPRVSSGSPLVVVVASIRTRGIEVEGFPRVLPVHTKNSVVIAKPWREIQFVGIAKSLGEAKPPTHQYEGAFRSGRRDWCSHSSGCRPAAHILMAQPKLASRIAGSVESCPGRIHRRSTQRGATYGLKVPSG